jgi:hypothetical protein
LEVALVRVTAPEADVSPAALLERIERLERRLAAASGGGGDSAGSGGSGPGAAGAGSASGSPAADRTESGGEPPSGGAAAESQEPSPSATTGEAGSPADRARALARSTTETSATDRAGRGRGRPQPPGLDVVDAGPTTPPPVPPGARPSTDRLSTDPSAEGGPPAATPRRGALGSYRSNEGGRPPTPPSPPAEPATPAPTAAAGSGDLPSRDELTKAWGDEVLGSLRGRTRALYAAGRFTAVEDGRAVFALPDPNHRDRCAAVQADVEAALASHFGRPVPLKLVTDNGGATTATTPPPRTPEPEDEMTDYADIADLPAAPPPDVASPTDRIKSAFPGAEEVQ